MTNTETETLIGITTKPLSFTCESDISIHEMIPAGTEVYVRFTSRGASLRIPGTLMSTNRRPADVVDCP